MSKYSFRELVIDSRTGLNPRQNFKLGNGDNYYITIKDIHNGRIEITDRTDRIDDDAVAKIKKRSRIKNGDILFTSIGRLGETAIVYDKNDTWEVNESIFIFTLNRELIEADYFCRLLQSSVIQERLTKDSSGSTFKSIKMNQLEKLTFDIPPLETQRKIAANLDKVTHTIDLCNAILEKLDLLVKSRFVELFGDPASNPHNWERVSLGELAEIKIGPFGTLLHKEDYIPNAHALVNPSHIIDGKIAVDMKLTVSDDKYNELSAYHLNIDDVVMGRRGEMGRCAVVSEVGLLCGTGSMIIRSNGRLKADYIQKIISFPSFKKTIEDMAVGQTMPNLNVPIVSNFMIICPPIEVQEQYYSFVEQTDKSKLAVKQVLEKAETLKKALMQEYFG